MHWISSNWIAQAAMLMKRPIEAISKVSPSTVIPRPRMLTATEEIMIILFVMISLTNVPMMTPTTPPK